MEVVAEAGDDKLESMRADLRRLSSSFAGQRVARARAERKVAVSEAKVEELRAKEKGVREGRTLPTSRRRGRRGGTRRTTCSSWRG